MATPDMTPGTTAWVHLDTLKTWDKNPRNITAAIGPVSESIRRFGFVAPVVVWASKGRIIAGHTRTGALRALLAKTPTFVPKGAPVGTLPGFAPVHFHEFASEADATAYGIADNKLNEVATWNESVLTDLLAGLSAPLLTLTGFSLPTLPEPPAPSLGGASSEAPASTSTPAASPLPGSTAPGVAPAGDPTSEWEGMPEYSSEEHKPFKSVTVHFRNEADYAAFCALVPDVRTRFMWFPAEVPGEPERTIGMFTDRVYADAAPE
jgi:hypothetical protein